jgi:hypothetical protein
VSNDKPAAPPPPALKYDFEQIVANMPKNLDLGELLKRASTVDLDLFRRPPSFSARNATAGLARVVRFSRLNGPGEETLDLDKCLQIQIGKRVDPRIPILDPKTLVFYYGTPEGRWILGLGGTQQAACGGHGYVEVHPMYVVHDLLLRGAPLPHELEKYRKFMTSDRSLAEAIAAWEDSLKCAHRGDETPKSAVPKQQAQSLDDLTPTAWKLLRAIRQLDATSAETAKSRPVISARAGTGNHDSDHNKAAFRQLSDLGLITAKKRVGTWLTDAGMSALNKR